jgi:hypothetical protein
VIFLKDEPDLKSEGSSDLVHRVRRWICLTAFDLRDLPGGHLKEFGKGRLRKAERVPHVNDRMWKTQIAGARAFRKRTSAFAGLFIGGLSPSRHAGDPIRY